MRKYPIEWAEMVEEFTQIKMDCPQRHDADTFFYGAFRYLHRKIPILKCGCS